MSPLAEGSDSPAGLLGDTPARDYARKLSLFNHFAEFELRQAITSLDIQPGMKVLDAGCGSGEALSWLAEETGAQGLAIGMDLAAPHLAAAREGAAGRLPLLQADLRRLPLAPACFDLVWCVNTLHHLHDPLAGLYDLSALLRPGGRIALGQSSLLPEMSLAWDSRLERLTNEAVRRYYRERYRVDERALSPVRAIAGQLRQAGLQQVRVKTFVIERLAPLAARDLEYLLEAVFRGTWGERLRPYLCSADFAELSRLCDPDGNSFALHRPDFHFIQTFTLAVGRLGP